jgi:hypothetical protein
MSLSDCPKCWDSNCLCGYKYKDMGQHGRIMFSASILGVEPHQIAEALSGVIPLYHPKKEEE